MNKNYEELLLFLNFRTRDQLALEQHYRYRLMKNYTMLAGLVHDELVRSNVTHIIPMKKAYLLVSFVLVYIHFGVG
jgi:hypothetical protein